MAEESAVKVCVRVRPLIAREESSSPEEPEPIKHFWKANNKTIHQIDDENPTKSFSFDRVFTADESTNQLYQAIAKPLVVSAVEGYNGTIFAYGQTSSGKTFTMMGNGGSVPGVIPLAVEDVFQSITNLPKKEFLLRVSYMEIYNETVVDLLVSSWKRKPLEVRETINKNVFVADLTEEVVTSSAQALAWIRKGEKNRHYGKTKMNQRSSRSHTIFRMIIESRDRSDPASGENADGGIIVSHLNLVDLAGSERASQTGAEGTRFKEGCNINRSLFTLGQVIKKLTDENQKLFTSYRDSKLTRILQNSLGGNAKTVIICTITPVALEETLSTLQFASTAKKMKNDPHVTEVSDDGALLKRYRNEIVDLKRRLHEVSSVTQTTATEKEVLSQLLQEKEMLQREQQDRIRNLTMLLVTSTTQTTVRKVPKRRVTWGGKMLKLAVAAAEEQSCDLTLSQSFMPKRKAYCSSLSELCEDDEEFDSHWEIPDEPPDETETSQSSVMVRSFGDSLSGGSSDWLTELSNKVSALELQLDLERQQKVKAWEEVEKLKSSVAKLPLEGTSGEVQLEGTSGEVQLEGTSGEVQLELEGTSGEVQLELEGTSGEVQLELEGTSGEVQLELEGTSGEVQLEGTSGELEGTQPRRADLQLQTEAGLKQEAVEMLELKVADVEQQNRTLSDTVEQMKRQFAETAQLCEALAKEKEEVLTERDYLRQELGMFIEQTNLLEEEKATLSKELWELRETEEFKTLEDGFNREHQNELQKEISNLKTALESSEAQCLQLQNKLDGLSEKLKTKTQFAEELQSMGGKDLMQEVAKLRRSLDDAEGLSRDTKKEWALLRSENMALEETNVTLSSSQEKMELEVSSLRVQLDREKSRYRSMQGDLQKELNLAFEENATLTSLLAGKVPKNLIDSFELEKTVTRLNKELAESREVQGTLSAQLEEFTATVDKLSKKVQEQQEEAGLLRQALQASQQEVERAQEQLSSASLREEQLRQECEDMKLSRDSLDSDLQRAEAEGKRLQAAVEEKLLQVQEQQEEAGLLRQALQASQQEVERAQEQLSSASLREEQLRQECEDMKLSRDSLDSDLQRAEAEGKRLQAAVEEKLLQLEGSQQLSVSLEGRVEEMQRLLQDLEEKLAHSEASRSTEEDVGRELQEQVKGLREELQELRAATEALVSEHKVQTEELLSTIASLSAEGEQLRAQAAARPAVLDSVQEKQRTCCLADPCEQESDGDQMLQELQRDGEQEAQAELEELRSAVASLSAERDQLRLDLQDNVDIMIEVQEELRTAIQKDQEQKKLIRQLKTSKPEEDPSETSAQLDELRAQLEGSQQLSVSLEGRVEEMQRLLQDLEEKLAHSEASRSTEEDVGRELQEQVKGLREELQELRAATEALVSEHKVQTEELLSTIASLSAEGEQLRAQIKSLEEEVQNVEAERATLLREKQCAHQSPHDTQELQHTVASLREDRQQLQDVVDTLRKDKQQLEDSSQSLLTQMESLSEELRQANAERAQLEDGSRSLLTQVQEQQEEAGLLRQALQASQQEVERAQEQLSSASLREEQLRQECEDMKLSRDSLDSDLQRAEAEGKRLQAAVEEKLLQLEGSQQLSVSLEGRVEEMQRLLQDLEEKLAHSEASRSTEEDVGRELQEQVKGLREELQELRAATEALVSEHKVQTEELLSTIASLSAEGEQLRAQVRGLEEELQRSEGDALLRDQSVHSSSQEHQQLQEQLRLLDQQRWQREAILKEVKWDNRLLQARLDLMSCEMEEQREEEERRHQEERALLQQQVQQLQQQWGCQAAPQASAGVTQQALPLQTEQLKEAPVRTCSPDQDRRHLLEEKENTIQTLQSKLGESQTVASQKAAMLEELRAKVFQLEVELRSASEEHQKELHRLVVLLRDKEDSVRKLKDTLRRQQGEDTSAVLTGAELHARLTQPRGLSRSSAQLEAEVQRLHHTVTELERTSSSQQAEISKWKSRALRLKSRAEADRAPSPRTPRRRGFSSEPPNLQSPRKVLDSPRKVLDSPRKVLDSPRKVLDSPRKVLDSPKKMGSPRSLFFDVGGADILRRAAPKQFFDNSRLGTVPDPENPQKQLWPLSPSQEELCRTQ